MDYSVIQWVFSGIGIFILGGIIKAVFLPHPIIKITKEEEAFLNNYLRLGRKFLIEIFLMIAITSYTIIITELNLLEHKITSNFPFITSSIPITVIYFIESTLIIGIMFIFSLRIHKIKHLIFRKFYESRHKKRGHIYFFMLSTFFIVYFLIIVINYGLSINIFLAILNTSYSLEQVSSIHVLFKIISLPKPVYIAFVLYFVSSYMIFRLLLANILWFFKQMSNTKILTTITLTNGEKLLDKYILRPSVDGNILIGDKPSLTEDCKKIMLPKQNIMYIEFNRINIIFERENHHSSSSNKNILLPPFNE